MAQLMLQEHCAVTIVHSKTNNIKEECLKADILIAAAGAKLVKGRLGKNCIVIDVGINKLEGKIIGDTDYENIKNQAKAITPVPGIRSHDYCLLIKKYARMLQKIKLHKIS